MIDSNSKMMNTKELMSFSPSLEEFIPESLRERAKVALDELNSIHKEFSSITKEWEELVKAREKYFEDAMVEFNVTKDDWIRLVDGEGNVQWVNSNLLPWNDKDVSKDVIGEHWPFGDTSEWK